MDRRKRKAADAFAQQGRFAGEDGARRRNADEQELYVLGLPATLFRDDVTAESVESNLLRWHADGDVLTDRFDVLLLLDEAQLPRPSRTPPAVDAGIEEQLDAERYRELDYSREHLLEHPAAFRLPATGEGVHLGLGNLVPRAESVHVMVVPETVSFQPASLAPHDILRHCRPRGQQRRRRRVGKAVINAQPASWAICSLCFRLRRWCVGEGRSIRRACRTRRFAAW